MKNPRKARAAVAVIKAHAERARLSKLNDVGAVAKEHFYPFAPYSDPNSSSIAYAKR